MLPCHHLRWSQLYFERKIAHATKKLSKTRKSCPCSQKTSNIFVNAFMFIFITKCFACCRPRSSRYSMTKSICESGMIPLSLLVQSSTANSYWIAASQYFTRLLNKTLCPETKVLNLASNDNLSSRFSFKKNNKLLQC